MDWYSDPAQLRRALAEHGSWAGVARATGVPASTLKHHAQRHGISSRPSLEVVREGDEWLLAALKKAGDNATVEDLADTADVSPRKVREAAERLGLKGYRVADEGARVVLQRVPPPSQTVHRALFKGERVRLGVVSDTHLGSKHCRLEELHMAYNLFRDEGIDTVYHGGDLVCGYGIFPGQQNEVELHSYEDQVNFAVENYPRVPGITTHIISGNHDIEGAFGKAGANPVVAFANQRDDVVFCGDYMTTFEFEQGTRVYSIHPKGGIGYAADYKIRKLVEGFEGGRKPNIMLVAHFHRRGAFEARGVQCVMTGCFESGGSFGPRLGLSDPAVGAHILDFTIADDGSVVRFSAEWFRFWSGRTVERAA